MKVRHGSMNLPSTESSDIRKFGLIAMFFFGILSVLGAWRGKIIPVFIFGFFSIAGLGFILFPVQLRPVCLIWLRITRIVGKVVTAIMLTIAYYFVITPVALIKRLFGKAPLPTKPDKNLDTYWQSRSEPVQSKERFLRRY